MKLTLAALAAGCSVLLTSVPALAQQETPEPPEPAAVSIVLDQSAVAIGLGDRFTFTSTVRNDTDQPLPGVVASLNVVGLDRTVYVDPEDWSSERTQFVGTLPAGESTELEWEVQAVNPGRLAAYVITLSDQGGLGIAVSPALRLTVADKSTAGGGGLLPVVIGVPVAALLVIGVFAFLRRRRSRSSAG